MTREIIARFDPIRPQLAADARSLALVEGFEEMGDESGEESGGYYDRGDKQAPE